MLFPLLNGFQEPKEDSDGAEYAREQREDKADMVIYSLKYEKRN
jgi:hypothetical protein